MPLHRDIARVDSELEMRFHKSRCLAGASSRARTDS